MTKWLDRELNEVGEDSLTPYSYPLYQITDDTLPLAEQQALATVFYLEQAKALPSKAEIGDTVCAVLANGSNRPAIVVAANPSFNDTLILNVQTVKKVDDTEDAVSQQALRYSIKGEPLTWHLLGEVTEIEQEKLDKVEAVKAAQRVESEHNKQVAAARPVDSQPVPRVKPTAPEPQKAKPAPKK